MLLLRLAKFDSDKTKILDFRENLKSTGQSKFTIDEKEETAVSMHAHVTDIKESNNKFLLTVHYLIFKRILK